jgi:hypothetical protein
MDIYISKLDETLEIPFTELPEVSREHVIKYGLTQILSDACASVSVKNGESKDDARALVMKKLDALIDGTVRVAGVRTSDPVRARAIELAIDMTVKGQFKKEKKELDAKAMRAAALTLIDRNPAYRHLAEKQLEREAEDAAQLAAMLANADLEGLEAKAA